MSRQLLVNFGFKQTEMLDSVGRPPDTTSHSTTYPYNPTVGRMILGKLIKVYRRQHIRVTEVKDTGVAKQINDMDQKHATERVSLETRIIWQLATRHRSQPTQLVRPIIPLQDGVSGLHQYST